MMSPSNPRNLANIKNPLSRTRFAFRTLKCRLHPEDVNDEANREAIDLLFEQYGRAVEAFLRLIPIRTPYRRSRKGPSKDAFRKDDYVAVKALAPGLFTSIRTAARDRAIEMWKARQAREARGLRTSAPGSCGNGNYRTLL